ncbi:hypothetical protein A3838_05220 [Streptomyces badius]|nr:hypothetical protein A3838_05220 [Streptomyces badius]
MPTISPVAVRAVASAARAIPKSISRGPLAVSRTLPGFTSRWTSPAACTAARARASSRPRTVTLRTGSGPRRATTSDSVGPGTNSVASQGRSALVSAPVTDTAQGLSTRRAASASRRKRARKSSSPACSGRITLIAASAPASVRPR